MNERLFCFGKICAACGPIIHLQIDICVEIAAPGRIEIVAPYSLQIGGKGAGTAAGNEQGSAVIEEKFRDILDKDMDIIHIAFSSALSGSYNNVCMVARELEEEYPEARITVIDSLNVSLGETILLLHAAELKDKGSSYDEIVTDLETYKQHINVQFTVDDLFHLQRGGRVSKTTALVGSALNLKPFLTVTDAGTLISDGTARGRKKSIRTLVDRMKDTLEDTPDTSVPVGIVHGNCIEDANTVAELVKSETGFTNIIINDISPSIGTHAGPGALGLLYYGKEKPPVKEEK